MTSAKSIFFELIKSVFCDKKVGDDLKISLTEEVLGNVYALAKKHDLAHLVGIALSKIGYVASESASKKFEKEKLVAVFRYERLNYDYLSLKNTLTTNNISFVPLKGLIIRDFYPEPWMRTSCDIDVLVEKEQALRAVECLCEQAGFSKCKDFTAHDYILKSQSGMTVELHYSLLQDGALPKSDTILDSVWDNLKDNNLNDSEKCLTGEFFVFYHIVHMAKHFIGGGCGIRPFIDLYLINQKMDYNEIALKKLLHQAQLEEFYVAVLSLIKVWMKGEPHTQITHDIEQFVLHGGVYGNLNNSAKVQVAKGNKKSKTLRRLIFLPKSSLEIMYPNLKKYPILLPFYQIKRWFKIFNKSSRKRAGYIVKATNSVSSEQANTTQNMLEKIGLK